MIHYRAPGGMIDPVLDDDTRGCAVCRAGRWRVGYVCSGCDQVMTGDPPNLKEREARVARENVRNTSFRADDLSDAALADVHMRLDALALELGRQGRAEDAIAVQKADLVVMTYRVASGRK